MTRVLVAGIGNVFLGDDGFGVAVVERLAKRKLPDGVSLMDAGIRGFDLTMALLDDYAAAILVDATARGGAPGTLYVIDPDADDAAPGDDASTADRSTNDGADGFGGDTALLDAHSLEPAKVLAYLRACGKQLGVIRVVGCEPERFGEENESKMGLSAPVSAAIEPAVALVEGIVQELMAAYDAAFDASRSRAGNA
ncbi:MAG TPA: hydrogenase maturation protease [Polyangiaceae bacterium]|jgi:hydrogenase maturation protease|nr:hydrogenase maturation protease [Polyangiaceae bacterium]